MTYTLIFFLLSLSGIWLCEKIHKEKKQEKVLTCYLGADCENVVRGQFSSFLGIGLEVYGGLYYSFILYSYLILYIYNFQVASLFSILVFGISVFAFIFSLSLTFIQAFIIKKWCSWCLISASLCMLIFILGVIRFL